MHFPSLIYMLNSPPFSIADPNNVRASEMGLLTADQFLIVVLCSVLAFLMLSAFLTYWFYHRVIGKRLQLRVCGNDDAERELPDHRDDRPSSPVGERVPRCKHDGQSALRERSK